MSKQFSFFMSPGDLSEVEDRIRSDTAITILKGDSSHAAPVELSSMRINQMGKDDLTIYLTRPEDVPRVRMERENGSSGWFIDVLTSQVIEVSRSFFRKPVLRRGRMYFTAGYYGDDDTWIRKDVAFLSWATEVFSVTKKTMTRSRFLDAYLGREAKVMSEEGSIDLLDP